MTTGNLVLMILHQLLRVIIIRPKVKVSLFLVVLMGLLFRLSATLKATIMKENHTRGIEEINPPEEAVMMSTTSSWRTRWVE